MSRANLGVDWWLRSEMSLGANDIGEGPKTFCKVFLEVLRSHDIVVVVEKDDMVGTG